jgi:hypothetical protein
MEIVKTMMEKDELTFEEFVECLWVYPIFGDMEIQITTKPEKNERKIQIIDRHTCGEEDMSCTVKVMHTEDDVITVIEHSHGFFTHANKQHIIHTAYFIDKKILNIPEDGMYTFKGPNEPIYKFVPKE